MLGKNALGFGYSLYSAWQEGSIAPQGARYASLKGEINFGMFASEHCVEYIINVDKKERQNISFIFPVPSSVWPIISRKPPPALPAAPLRNDGGGGEKAFQCEIHSAFKCHRRDTPTIIVITHPGGNQPNPVKKPKMLKFLRNLLGLS